jgi:hypothetical protein
VAADKSGSNTVFNAARTGCYHNFWLLHTDTVSRRLALECVSILGLASEVPARLKLLQRMIEVENRVTSREAERELTKLRLESMELALSEEDLLSLRVRIDILLESLSTVCMRLSSAVLISTFRNAASLLVNIRNTYLPGAACITRRQLNVGG